MAVLKPHRPPGTPVIVASNLGRAQEKLRISELGRFDPSDVDMLTIVIVGSVSSRVFTRGEGSMIAYTPRGYSAKRTLNS